MSVPADPAVKAFHRKVAGPLTRCGALRLLRLRRGKRAAASVYVLFRRPRAYYYIGGADPDLAAASPGPVGILCAVEDTLARGRTSSTSSAAPRLTSTAGAPWTGPRIA